uniref:Kinase n=2 Tax=Lutzomyia longipalpis TaxID=7200 RepID=A0A1B0C9M9_LUTLO
MSRLKLPPYQRKKNSGGNLYRKSCPPSYLLPFSEMTSVPSTNIPNLPVGCVPLDNQVAGHTFQAGEMGILRENDGTILKPAAKPLCGAHPSLVALRDLVPEYRGTQKLFVGDRYVDFMKLVDATDGMLEPCIMDVKIGARTWDPLATEEKRAAEEQKYLACKKALGLCIPGFQVYHLGTGRIKRYSKDYGKKLNEKTVRDALRIFLNADSGLCRALLVQLLSGLWAIQKWARTQKTLRLYSSSVLLVYDARRLRSSLQSKRKISKDYGKKLNEKTVRDALRIFLNADSGLCRALLVQLLSGLWAIQKWARTQKTLRLYSSSVLLVYDARRLRSSLQSKRKIRALLVQLLSGLWAIQKWARTQKTLRLYSSSVLLVYDARRLRNPIQSYQKIQRSHSTQNNYDEDLKEIRDKYTFMLHRMCAMEKKEWATVKMIDFAHAFPADEDSPDTNYLFGIENLVKMFEDFLKECE